MNKFSTIGLFQACNRVVRGCKPNRKISTCHSVLCKKDDINDQVEDNSKKEKADRLSKKTEAKKKLNDLLVLMSKVNTNAVKPVQIPKPREFGKMKYAEKKAEFNEELERREKEQLGYRLEKAAKNLAESLGGDQKKTESELLNLYLYGRLAERQAEKNEGEKKSLSDLLTTMKIEKETEPSRADQVRAYRDNRPDSMSERMPMRSDVSDSINIFGEIPFNFFSLKSEEKQIPPVVLNTWNYLNERDLRLCVTHPPSNIFEQLIQWTNDGKLWRFPIDNEQDWAEEANVDFTEHVFLERHIESWCPTSGPIRHFMELVCNGLSKNPYMTVSEKRAHMSFYENYFRSKNALLTELGMPQIPEKSELAALA